MDKTPINEKIILALTIVNLALPNNVYAEGWLDCLKNWIRIG